MKPLNDFWKAIIKIFSVNWIIFFIELTVGVLIVRLFSIEDKGYFSGILAFGGVMTALVSMGSSQSAVYSMKKNLLTNNEARDIQKIILASGVIFSFIFCVVFYGLLDKYHTELPTLIFAFIISITVGNQSSILFNSTYYSANKKVKKYTVLRVITPISKLIAILFAYYLGRSIFEALLFYLIVEALNLIIIHKHKVFNFALPNKKHLILYLKYGIKANISVIINNLTKRTDYFFISTLLGIESLGRYSIAYVFYTLLFSIPQALNGVLFGDMLISKTSISKVLPKLLFISSTGVLVVITFSGEILRIIYGTEYSELRYTASILGASALIDTISSPFKLKFLASNEAWKITLDQSLRFIIQSLILYFLTMKFGLEGAALGVLIGSISVLVIRFITNKMTNEKN